MKLHKGFTALALVLLMLAAAGEAALTARSPNRNSHRGGNQQARKYGTTTLIDRSFLSPATPALPTWGSSGPRYGWPESSESTAAASSGSSANRRLTAAEAVNRFGGNAGKGGRGSKGPAQGGSHGPAEWEAWNRRLTAAEAVNAHSNTGQGGHGGQRGHNEGGRTGPAEQEAWNRRLTAAEAVNRFGGNAGKGGRGSKGPAQGGSHGPAEWEAWNRRLTAAEAVNAHSNTGQGGHGGQRGHNEGGRTGPAEQEAWNRRLLGNGGPASWRFEGRAIPWKWRASQHPATAPSVPEDTRFTSANRRLLGAEAAEASQGANYGPGSYQSDGTGQPGWRYSNFWWQGLPTRLPSPPSTSRFNRAGPATGPADRKLMGAQVAEGYGPASYAYRGRNQQYRWKTEISTKAPAVTASGDLKQSIAAANDPSARKLLSAEAAKYSPASYNWRGRPSVLPWGPASKAAKPVVPADTRFTAAWVTQGIEATNQPSDRKLLVGPAEPGWHHGPVADYWEAQKEKSLPKPPKSFEKL